MHRKSGPALIFYYEDGKIRSKEFFQDSIRHRIDGPAYILYNEDEQIKDFVYFINEKEIKQYDTDIDLSNWPLTKEDQVKLKLQMD